MTTISKRIWLATIIGWMAMPLPSASAHDAAKGPNGGPVVQVDDKHLELTTTNQALVVYVSDAKHDPIPTLGATGRAIVQADGKTSTLALAPAVPNVLSGTTDAPLTKGARVVITATVPGLSNLQARFVLP